MKTGIELIAQERQQQIEKHDRSVAKDVANNNSAQLIEAAVHLIGEHTCFDFRDTDGFVPKAWDKAIYNKMKRKSYKERLIISGALIAAEIDRLNEVDNLPIGL